MILFIAILSSLVVGCVAGAFAMAYRLTKDTASEYLTGEASKRLVIMRNAGLRAAIDANARRDA